MTISLIDNHTIRVVSETQTGVYVVGENAGITILRTINNNNSDVWLLDTPIFPIPIFTKTIFGLTNLWSMIQFLKRKEIIQTRSVGENNLSKMQSSFIRNSCFETHFPEIATLRRFHLEVSCILKTKVTEEHKPSISFCVLNMENIGKFEMSLTAFFNYSKISPNSEDYSVKEKLCDLAKGTISNIEYLCDSFVSEYFNQNHQQAITEILNLCSRMINL